MAREPEPERLVGILSPDEVEDARNAAERFGGRDEARFRRARNAFE
ncbi:hypothetical protein [Natrinema halophilum]|uniref:Uncharacterized protein n=1 Tax=Natrinema halophilum TaxID=1699371 RepID=A0A7D5K7M2_9EURY|nr:hypothetical protein [Natrinema halophilum]QLG50123.1 hypothetical protein HYG82_15290 [Natrinema halophilum]